MVLAGSHLPAEVQLLAYEMNRLLGAIGSTINYIEVDASADSILSLASKINEGSVERLFILGGNPVYQTKGFINWEDLSKSSNSLYALEHQLMKVPRSLITTWGSLIILSHGTWVQHGISLPSSQFSP